MSIARPLNLALLPTADLPKVKNTWSKHAIVRGGIRVIDARERFLDVRRGNEMLQSRSAARNFPVRPKPAVDAVDIHDPSFTAYCDVRNDQAKWRGERYAPFKDIRADWANLLACGEAEAQLNRLLRLHQERIQ